MIHSKTTLNVGDKFTNENNGGQMVTITSLSHQGVDGVIEYHLHEQFRFSSLNASNCEESAFRKTFSI